jgi:N-acetylglutamate synthase-like GNAT family acetyltransferase
MIEIVNVKNYSGGLESAIEYIFKVWGDGDNHAYYRDAIENSSLDEEKLPRFYLMLSDKQVIGCCGLIINDFISRQDLYPWLSSLYIEESFRGNAYARLFMAHVLKEAALLGFERVFLTTDHKNYYEKYGWRRIENGIHLITYKETRIYVKDV